MSNKRKRVRARAGLEVGPTFKIAQKMDDPNATLEAMASTALDVIEEARDQGDDRIMRMKEVAETVGISKQAIYARIRRGTFPKGRPLGNKTPTSPRGWLRSEVMAWLREQAKKD